MADVFLTVAHGLQGGNKLAVVKRLRNADDVALTEMFLDEARLGARLNHPNIVHTYEVGEVRGEYFIAMEYLEGQPLNRVISEGTKRGTPLDPWASARVVSDALAGLHHAHTLTDFDGIHEMTLAERRRKRSPRNMINPLTNKKAAAGAGDPKSLRTGCSSVTPKIPTGIVPTTSSQPIRSSR